MEINLAGRKAIVNGASQGIGRAVALAFAREGVEVALCARNHENLSALAREIQASYGGRALPIQADATVLADIQGAVRQAYETLGGIDILVNCAGDNPIGSITDITDEQWVAGQIAKPLGYIRYCREVIPYISKTGTGRIINVSGAAARDINAGYPAGAVGNVATVNFTRALALQLAAQNVLVTAVSPGPIDTPRWARFVANHARANGLPVEESARRLAAGMPLGRVGRTEEVAGLILFLCSDLATYITGTCIYVDGGKAPSV